MALVTLASLIPRPRESKSSRLMARCRQSRACKRKLIRTPGQRFSIQTANRPDWRRPSLNSRSALPVRRLWPAQVSSQFTEPGAILRAELLDARLNRVADLPDFLQLFLGRPLH